MSETLKFRQPAQRQPYWPKKALGKGLLTPNGVARTLDIDPRVLRRMVDMGEVETVTLAGYCYIPKYEAERLRKLLSGEVSD